MLAGPRQDRAAADERVLNNIILCIDVSGSMGVPFGSKGTPFRGRAEAAREFCAFRKGDAFGLTIFGSEYIHWVPPTKSCPPSPAPPATCARNNMPPWMGGTMIANALRGCRDQLIRTPRATAPSSSSAMAAAPISRTAATAPSPPNSPKTTSASSASWSAMMAAAAGGLATIAAGTGGKVFTAGDRAALDAVFREIDRMQKARFKQVTADWVDDYTPLALAGLGSVAALFALVARPALHSLVIS
jgi:Ca-activated chloride channel homolog